MKKLISYFCILLLISSCNSNDSEVTTKTLYPEGFFSFKSQLYFSDGNQFYCTFRSWEHLYALRGNQDKPTSPILKYDELPNDMKFIKHCNVGILTQKFFE